MSETDPSSETEQSSAAEAAEYARTRVEEIEEKAAEDEAAIEAGEDAISLEEAVAIADEASDE